MADAKLGYVDVHSESLDGDLVVLATSFRTPRSGSGATRCCAASRSATSSTEPSGPTLAPTGSTCALVLAAFDAVIARPGFSDRTKPGQVVDLLARIAAVAGPSVCRAADEHVLYGLTNCRERERQFTSPR